VSTRTRAAELWDHGFRAKDVPANDVPDKDGWSKQRQFIYQVSPNARRDVAAFAQFANGQWTVAIYDMAQDVGEKRSAQVGLIFDRRLPKGYARETFIGKKAHTLDAARIAALGAFVEKARAATGVPGVSIGLVQDGKVSWDTPVTSVLPSFKLGDAGVRRGSGPVADRSRRAARVHVHATLARRPGLQDLAFRLAGEDPLGRGSTLGRQAGEPRQRVAHRLGDRPMRQARRD
jgi:hypothetical protein